MTLLLVIAFTALVIGAIVAAAAGAIRVDRALVARAEVRLEQRRAEGRMDAVLRDTVQKLFEAARGGLS